MRDLACKDVIERECKCEPSQVDVREVRDDSASYTWESRGRPSARVQVYPVLVSIVSVISRVQSARKLYEGVNMWNYPM